MSSTYRTCVRCTIGRAPIWHLLLALAFSVGDHSGRPHHSSSIQRAQIPLGAMFLRGAGPAGDGRYATGRHCARFLPRSSNRTPVAIYRDLARPLAITTDPAGRPWPGRLTLRLPEAGRDRKSTRLNSSHVAISYAVFCLKKKNKQLDHHSLPNKKQPHPPH